MAIDPTEALDRLLARVAAVATQSVSPSETGVAGRVLAERVLLDRDSPACDVSAMDGYAVRQADLAAAALPLTGECPIGRPPRDLESGAAMKIFTGSPVPRGADTVIRVEAAKESQGAIRLNGTREIKLGADIRRQGENARAGDVAIEAGGSLSPATIGALATIGPASIQVHRRLRIAIVTTGNELVSSGASDGQPLEPWRLRDSNGPALRAMLAQPAWVASADWAHAPDSLEALTQQVRDAIADADAVVLTGGVSKGDHDYVPDAVQAAGAELVFHRVKARPGQPTLAAVADGKPVLGLPGNPLSVLCAGRRLLVPALRKRAGFSVADAPPPLVALEEWAGKTVPLTWWRPVRFVGPGRVRLSTLMGSGDTIGPANSDGFVEIPPESTGPGPYSFYPWSV